MTAPTNTQTKLFGTGNVFALVSGSAPVQVGVLQDIEIDISAAIAELYGQYQFPVATGRGKGKITGKAKTGQFDINLFNSLYYGGTVNNTQYNKVYTNEAHTAGASLTTIAPTNLGSSNVTDLGIYYQSNGVQLTLAPTSSQVSSAAGLYWFASSGLYTVSSQETSSTPFLINYDSLQTGNSLAVSNQLMGVQPVFQLEMWEGFTDFSGRTNFDLKLNRCVSNKFNFPFKNSDFAINGFEFECFADSNGNIMTLGVGV